MSQFEQAIQESINRELFMHAAISIGEADSITEHDIHSVILAEGASLLEEEREEE